MKKHISDFFVLVLNQAIKPTVLMGTSGVGKTFTKEVVEAMATLNEVSFVYFFESDFYLSMLLFLMLIFVWWVETIDSCTLKPNFSSRVHGGRSLHMDQGNNQKLIDTFTKCKFAYI